MIPVKKISGLFFLCTLLIAYSCSSGSESSLLNFLFDGVPLPDTSVVMLKEEKTEIETNIADVKTNSEKSVITEFYHLPYKEKMCSDCHDSEFSNKLIISMPELCYECHSDFNSEFDYIHYPTEAGECNSCHHPHKSKLKMLLLKPVRELCADCHDLEELLSGDMHSGIDDTECTDCHYPHGSDDVKLLK